MTGTEDGLPKATEATQFQWFKAAQGEHTTGQQAPLLLLIFEENGKS
jgi:hypothetical protein